MEDSGRGLWAAVIRARSGTPVPFRAIFLGGARVDDFQPVESMRRRRRRLRISSRLEWIAGAEEEWRRRNCRPMTAEELQRVLRQYPGDA
jgi:hypothetical protein